MKDWNSRFAGDILPATPGDVLAYRTAWDPYVMGTLRVIDKVGDSFIAAASAPPSGYTAQVLTDMGNSYKAVVQAMLADWNAFAGIKPEVFLADASNILSSEQALVKKVSDFRTGVDFKKWNSLALPAPPSLDVQQQIVSRLEGTSVIANGLLNMFSSSASDGLQVIAGKAGEVVGDTVKGVGGALWKNLPWWAWPVGAVLSLGVLVTAKKALIP